MPCRPAVVRGVGWSKPVVNPGGRLGWRCWRRRTSSTTTRTRVSAPRPTTAISNGSMADQPLPQAATSGTSTSSAVSEPWRDRSWSSRGVAGSANATGAKGASTTSPTRWRTSARAAGAQPALVEELVAGEHPGHLAEVLARGLQQVGGRAAAGVERAEPALPRAAGHHQVEHVQAAHALRTDLDLSVVGGHDQGAVARQAVQQRADQVVDVRQLRREEPVGEPVGMRGRVDPVVVGVDEARAAGDEAPHALHQHGVGLPALEVAAAQVRDREAGALVAGVGDDGDGLAAERRDGLHARGVGRVAEVQLPAQRVEHAPLEADAVADQPVLRRCRPRRHRRQARRGRRRHDRGDRPARPSPRASAHPRRRAAASPSRARPAPAAPPAPPRRPAPAASSPAAPP